MSVHALAPALIDRLATRRPLSLGLLRLKIELEDRWPEGGPLIQLLVGFYDPTLDPAWVPVLWPSTQLTVMTSASALGASGAECAELLCQLRRGRQAMAGSPPRSHRLHHQTTPLAAFHASQWGRRPSRRAGLYVLTAGAIHRGVRSLERQMLSGAIGFGSRLDANLYSYLRAARILCEDGPPTHLIPASLRKVLLRCR